MVFTPTALNISAGRYIVAVSGGVDSMVLIDLLRQRTGVECIVAHVNHGIRLDSEQDENLVKDYCTSHNISFISTRLHLKKNASEQAARQARYLFLQQCRIKFKAIGIITAHHQNDVIETAIINVLRGTGWRGIAPFQENTQLQRPLLEYTKDQLLNYAKTHKLRWREDTTNTDQTYLRNYVRRTIIPVLDQQQSQWQNKFLQLIRKQRHLRRTIEDELAQLIALQSSKELGANHTERYLWCMTPLPEAYELLQTVFRVTCGHSLLREQVESALLFAKIAKPGKAMLISTDWQVRVTLRHFIVEPRTAVVQ
jgi:tRNA(Ile)-lysidine synthetase-like protein